VVQGVELVEGELFLGHRGVLVVRQTGVLDARVHQLLRFAGGEGLGQRFHRNFAALLHAVTQSHPTIFGLQNANRGSESVIIAHFSRNETETLLRVFG